MKYKVTFDCFVYVEANCEAEAISKAWLIDSLANSRYKYKSIDVVKRK
jgi:hypothetical protein